MPPVRQGFLYLARSGGYQDCQQRAPPASAPLHAFQLSQCCLNHTSGTQLEPDKAVSCNQGSLNPHEMLMDQHASKQYADNFDLKGTGNRPRYVVDLRPLPG